MIKVFTNIVAYVSIRYTQLGEHLNHLEDKDMTTLEKYNETLAQIRALERQAAELKAQLESEHIVEYDYSAGLYTTTKEPKCLYWNYGTKTYYTKGILKKANGKAAGRPVTLGQIRDTLKTLQEKGFTEVE